MQASWLVTVIRPVEEFRVLLKSNSWPTPSRFEDIEEKKTKFNRYPVYLTPSQIERKLKELLGKFTTENPTNLYAGHRNEFAPLQVVSARCRLWLNFSRFAKVKKY
jgi:hypothetical protein